MGARLRPESLRAVNRASGLVIAAFGVYALVSVLRG
jgi:hypothetical protein